jgi:hypothetical protein
MLVKGYNDVVNFLSFAKNLRDLRTKINLRIDLPEIITPFPDSHPRGFIKEFKKRRTTIVESYLRITKNLESVSYDERINALRLLAEHINYSRSLKMPLNTARVQLALMKEVVKNRDNKRIQLELMRDFSVSSFGHPRVIRRFLKKFDIIEVPETGEELKDLKMGWDFHVHDNTSYGRKTQIQLIIDAFIKGISELTVVYTNLDHEEAIKEVLEAGKTLGIKVNIAIEFSAITNGSRFHYIYILPEFSSDKKKFKKFLKQKSHDFKEFLNQLEENDKKRKKTINLLIENFNNIHLPKINEGFTLNSVYYLQPIQVQEELNNGVFMIYSSRQLGELVYPKMKKVFENRALHITAMKKRAEGTPELFSDQEIYSIETSYYKIRDQYRELDPEKIRIEYFAGHESFTPETAVESLKDIYHLAKKTEGSIKFIQPLEHGLEAAVNLIIDHCEIFSHAEIFNIYDTIGSKESDFIILTNFIKLINHRDKHQIVKFLQDNKLGYQEKNLERALDHLKENTLIPAIGSDATGRSTLAPGMGFVMENRLPRYQRKYFRNRHFNLPNEVSELVYQLARVPKSKLKAKEKPKIICLGKVDITKKNLLGDENIEKPINPLRAWEYLNPAIRNFIFILIGFIPAYFTVGIEYACLWLAITGSRNMFVDVISANGLKPNDWHYQDVNWTNLAHSLFWTGFSVPILGFVKARFDVIWTLPHEGALFEFVKFFFINTANGLYLASHNYLRGFDKVTIRGNLFRSIMAWPFATLFSPLGNAVGIPSIVQAKFWSDFVASIIEGSGKYKNILKLKDNIMKKLLPELQSDDEETVKLATLDLIYFINESTRAKTAFVKQVFGNISLKHRIKNIFSARKIKPVPNHIYHQVKGHFKKENSYNELTEYIISHYNREHSIYLLQLISENYDQFSQWLDEIHR